MTKNYKLATCGLSCDLCDANTTKIQDNAKYLLDAFKDPMFSGVLSMTNPDFKPENIPIFKEILEILKKNPPCPGCNGRKDCAINQCANNKKIENCAMCNYLNIESQSCSAPLEPPKTPFMPPAPIFFNGLVKRYRKWNIENLSAIKQGNNEEINRKLDKMIREGKTNRDVIDFSVNLFDSIKNSEK